MHFNALIYDQFTPTPVEQLEPGMLVMTDHGLQQIEKLNGSRAEDVMLVDAYPPDKAIVIMLGRGEEQHLAMAMDFCGADLHEFFDGTAMIANFEEGACNIYSPRLPKSELIGFTREHIGFYESFYERNESLIDEGHRVHMIPFWQRQSEAEEVQ